MRKPYYLALLLLFWLIQPLAAQTLTELSVEKIMRDPKWIGTSPSGIFWGADSKTVYFNWNPDAEAMESLYKITLNDHTPRKVDQEERNALATRFGVYNRAETKRLYLLEGDLFLEDKTNGKITQITNTVERISNPSFSAREDKIFFIMSENLFSWNVNTGVLNQVTDFKRGNETPRIDRGPNEQDQWLINDQLAWFEVLKERKERREMAAANRSTTLQIKKPKTIYTGTGSASGIQISPDERFITYSIFTPALGSKRTDVPNYVTESGYTENIASRPKVGGPQGRSDLKIYDIQNDTVYNLKINDIPGLNDKPDYWDEYPENKDKKYSRTVSVNGPHWSGDGKYAVVIIGSSDNKDRWIMQLDPATGGLKLLDRQRDEAWIGGPGISSFGGSYGWMPDNKRFWFQSEETGYSHIHTVNLENGQKRALTSGKFEIYSPSISKDKKFWYFTSNEVHPGIRHFYRMPIDGGAREKITAPDGNNDVRMSPDEKYLAINYSYSNKPWELFLMENKKGAPTKQITQSLTEEFKSYNWIDPEIVTFKAQDGAEVYARLYKGPNTKPGAPAVIFVHGAGYLQNVHKWWSTYFREYMFHNLLVEKGYVVLDIDYRASSGYGRDWRTGIYRFMGGLDLSDHVDGARYLATQHGVDPSKIGIYGGSYGGFITLMAMFTQPDVFAAGAALRSVTDWAHYNHGYTSNILNIPVMDSIAYAKSSPIYYAEGLKGALLIAHGMIDTNVHFQDVVRLAQRLIELGKDNWEFAVYPLEDHGFVEPSSWTDEYKRILKLFEDNLK
jgi:dipeptidyl aminopeptidase/acylaminoacyl peptidase